MNSFTFIAFAIGMVCASAHNGVVHDDMTPVTCSEVLTSSDCTEVNPKSSLYTDIECGWGEDIDLCNTENCCGGILLGCITAWIGDGLCDTNNNNADCGNYDGGDCCECTCTDGSFDCGFGGGFNCLDPNGFSCNDDGNDDVGDAGDTCVPDFIADGDCDEVNNNAACGFDGGDCCDCICDESTCEASGSDCRDPNACGSNAGDDDELPMGPCDTPCLENCDLDWICTS